MAQTSTDWRLPENRREAFQRSYSFSLRHLNFPGMVYSMLPAIAEHYELDDDGRAWLAWLNGNTQNVVSSMLILEHAPRPEDWKDAVAFWNDHFKLLEWDTDRRHQKAKFGEATEKWAQEYPTAEQWYDADMLGGWEGCWDMAIGMPYMGRISAWSFYEFTRILLPSLPDLGGWFLEADSSRSHRNALCLLAGYDDAWGWDREKSELPFILGLLPQLEELAEELLREAKNRNGTEHPAGPDILWFPDPNVSRLTMESALCTFKSWHKPNRRYPNVYADMMYQRIKKAEARFGRELDLLWQIRKDTLPEILRLEDCPSDPGLVPLKQNWYRETGQIPLLHLDFPDMEPAGYEIQPRPLRKDPKWTS